MTTTAPAPNPNRTGTSHGKTLRELGLEALSVPIRVTFAPEEKAVEVPVKQGHIPDADNVLVITPEQVARALSGK